MRHYEIVLLVHPDQSEQVPDMVERYRGMVESSGGSIHRHEDWGMCRLAYAIEHVHKAYYVLLNIECDNETLRELNQNFQYNDAILRRLVIKCDMAITTTSPFAEAQAKRNEHEVQRSNDKRNERKVDAASSRNNAAQPAATAGTSADENKSEMNKEPKSNEKRK